MKGNFLPQVLLNNLFTAYNSNEGGDFMVRYSVAKFQDLVDDAKANNRVDALKEIGLAPLSNGKPKSFIQIKREYYQRFYEAMIPVAKPKKKTIYDELNEL